MTIWHSMNGNYCVKCEGGVNSCVTGCCSQVVGKLGPGAVWTQTGPLRTRKQNRCSSSLTLGQHVVTKGMSLRGGDGMRAVDEAQENQAFTL